jgi:2-amino-4-hydroxy-6-hydroxymethyldihydropteridine diphosphokinase
LGQREANLARAARLVTNSGQTRVIRSSSVYESDPWGFAHQPSFLNCVLETQTTLEPAPLLELAKKVENEVGREPTFRWGPRLIDIDILLYGDRIVQLDRPDLQIPHPRMPERAFVLVPLSELAAELVHPVQKTSIGRLAQKVEGREGVRPWGPPLELTSK